LKWDVFVARKGGMNNILAPLKDTTNINDTLSPSLSSHTELNRPAKLDAISPGKREEEPKIEDRPQTPANNQQQQQQVKVDERPQSPTPEQQQQRKIDDQQHITDEEAKEKNLLKGKPIIFIGGGPGIKKNNNLNIILYIDPIIIKGSGKGTQCEKMIAKYGFTHLSAGDLIRAASQDSTTEKGRYFNEAMSQGKLVSTVK